MMELEERKEDGIKRDIEEKRKREKRERERPTTKRERYAKWSQVA